MNKKWEFTKIDENKVKEISEKYNIPELLSTILVNRQITNEEQIRVFLNPTRNDFHDPYLMPDIEKAIKRIINAINKKEKVIIYGDYDVDGITSITVLKQFLEQRGLEADYYIPNRLHEGYGLNKQAIESFGQQGYTLMITVDCGISGKEEIDFANELKIDTIITDHHEPLEILPNAVAILNPKRIDSKYPFRELAGVGVVFKLIQALGIELNLDAKEYLKFLDIVCVGTISDIVPLIDENRVIAKLGLKLVEQTKNIGLKSLIKSSGYKTIDSNTISFGIAPRINACGRVGDVQDAIKLFLTPNIVEADKITEKLNQYNKNRQDTEKIIFKEAIEEINKNKLEEKDCIILGGDNWHNGVVGIVASKIAETYYKPTILISFDGEDAKGSGRSIQGFDLHEALCSCSKWLEKYGGHEMAVGLSLKKENFENFKKSFEEIAENLKVTETMPIIYIDKLLTIKDLDIDIIKSLSVLEPFGEANKIPIFAYKNIRIDSIRAVSEGKHLKMTLKDENTIIDAIGFGMGDLALEYTIGDKVDIAGTLEINTYNGIEKIQINLKSVMKSY